MDKNYMNNSNPNDDTERTRMYDDVDQTRMFSAETGDSSGENDTGLNLDEYDFTSDPDFFDRYTKNSKYEALPDLKSLGITQEDIDNYSLDDAVNDMQTADPEQTDQDEKTVEVEAEVKAEQPAALSIEEQISQQVQQKVEEEDALDEAKRAEEERTKAFEEGQSEPETVNSNKRPLLKRKHMKHGCLGGFLYLLFVVGVSLLLAFFVWVCANDVLGLIKPSDTVTVEIPENYTIDEVTDILYDKGIVQYKWLFNFYAKLTKADTKIDAGSYEVRRDLDYRALVYAMNDTSSYRTIVTVTIPEGFTLKQIFERLEENGVATVEEMRTAVAEEDFDYEWLEGIPEGDNRYEGFLYPDTYDFYVNEKPRSVLSKMLYNFETHLTAEWREKAEEMGYSIYEIVTMASMIEKESAGSDESPYIASVFYNRLDNWDFPVLGSDATIQYILPERKASLSADDLAIDSPYNTYIYPGLPYGPIACPGYYSLKAALYPAETSYYYFYAGKDGASHFFKTYEEQQEYIAQDQ